MSSLLRLASLASLASLVALLAASCADVGVAPPAPPAAVTQAQAQAQAQTQTVAPAAVAKAQGTRAPLPTSVAEAMTVDSAGHPITVWSKSAAAPRDVIVLVHGRTWSARPDFDLQVPGESRSLMDALVAEGFAVYAVDLRGYGSTPRDDTGWLTPDQAQRDLASVLRWVAGRHTQLAPPSVLGWSLGSMVAHLTAQRNPELVSTVTLYGYPRGPARKRARATSTEAAPERRATTARAAAEDFIVPGAISQPAIDAFVAAALAADPVRTDWRHPEHWNALKAAALQVPTLLIHGERDPYAPTRVQAAVFEKLGHGDRAWVILAGCDHAAHLERCAPRFVHAVVQFVRRPTLPRG